MLCCVKTEAKTTTKRHCLIFGSLNFKHDITRLPYCTCVGTAGFEFNGEERHASDLS